MGGPQRNIPMSGRMPRRATDIVEDVVVWVLSSMALLLLMITMTVGVATYDASPNAFVWEPRVTSR